MRISHKHSLPKKLAVHRVLYPSMLTESWVEGKSVEEKDAQPTERTAALWGSSSKINSRIWVNFTRNRLRLGSRHQEPPHTDVSKNLATVVVFLLLSHSWTTNNVRGILPGLRRRRTGQFKLNYWNKWTFPRHSNLLRCTCSCFGKHNPESTDFMFMKLYVSCFIF